MEDRIYTDKKTAPLAWHKFNRFFRVPLGFVVQCYNVVFFLNYELSLESICFILICLFEMVLMIMFFVGSFNWKKYTYKSIVVLSIFSVFFEFCMSALNTEDFIETMIYTLLYMIVAFFEVKYYKKRKLLFDDNKVVLENSYSDSASDITNDDTKILYCKYCGTKLDENAMFCKKCGRRIS